VVSACQTGTNHLLVSFITGFLVLLKLARKLVKNVEPDESSVAEQDRWAGVIFTSIIAAVLLGCAINNIFCLPDILSGFLNPEYWALNKLGILH